jgi:hypothetical protein
VSKLAALYTNRAKRVWIKGGGSLSNSAAPSGGIVTGVQQTLGVIGSGVTIDLAVPTITGVVGTEYQKNAGAWTAFAGGEAISVVDGDTINFRGTGMVAGETYTCSFSVTNPGVSAVTVATFTITAV